LPHLLNAACQEFAQECHHHCDGAQPQPSSGQRHVSLLRSFALFLGKHVLVSAQLEDEVANVHGQQCNSSQAAEQQDLQQQQQQQTHAYVSAQLKHEVVDVHRQQRDRSQAAEQQDLQQQQQTHAYVSAQLEMR
jgi:hypothetical protein